MTETDDIPAQRRYVRMVPEDATGKLTRDRILSYWTADFPKPKRCMISWNGSHGIHGIRERAARRRRVIGAIRLDEADFDSENEPARFLLVASLLLPLRLYCFLLQYCKEML